MVHLSFSLRLRNVFLMLVSIGIVMLEMRANVSGGIAVRQRGVGAPSLGATSTDLAEQTGEDGSESHWRQDLGMVPGVPNLTRHQEELLHALVGGIGPVIIPDVGGSEVNTAGDERDGSVVVPPPRDRRVMRETRKEGVGTTPEQIHIAFGDSPSEIVVMWSTASQGSSEVVYGVARNNLSLVESGQFQEFFDWEELFFRAKPFIHRVKLKNLTPGTLYYYRVKSNDQLSKLYSFRTMRDGIDWSPTLLVYGDMGSRGGAPTLRLLRYAARKKSVDAILHVGDFAYDLHDEGGLVGDDFMNRIQDIAAILPYMTCPGNHEIAHSFVHYKYRFSMPGANWPFEDKMWYSFNMGNVHFISYSTEVYFANGLVEEQIAWLTEDLKQANEMRAVRPWIIVFGHRPMYCSNADNDDCTKPNSRVRAGLEDLFYDNGVDLIIEAHEHSYERFWPMHRGYVTARHYQNPVAPVHIISGAAGCNEFDGVCVNPILLPRGDWSAFRSWIPGLYGYGRLHVANATHLHWQQHLALNDQVQDEFWIEQHNHGHFPPHL